ncbi:MAG: tyrosine-type recombinase/integrase [Bacilli bacterium]|nr:tyrosine-type recombinase/integrase [Bacilli bacterium]
MQDYIYKFLDYISLEKKYSDHTKTNYELDLSKYELYLKEKKLDYLKMEYKDISDYIIFLKKSNYKPKTINRALSTLRSFYKFLVNEQIIKNNPFDLVKGMKEEKRLPNYFKYKDFKVMIDSLKEEKPLNNRNKLILELLFATGVRVSELVNIKIEDIEFNKRKIKICGKGNKERFVFYGSYCNDILNKYLNEDRRLLLKNKETDYLLVNHLGTKLTDRGVRSIINKIIKKAEIHFKVSPHTFRHSFATMMLNEGCNIKSVAELLGHSNLNTTSIYTHLTNEEVRKAYLKSHPRGQK